MSIRGCYLHYRDVTSANERPTGMDLKVAGQIAALQNAGLNCDFIHCPQPETLASTVISCLPLMDDGVRWPSPQRVAQYDYMYIRRPRFASKQLIRFLGAAKQANPRIHILYEVPTYPYDAEMEPLHMRPAGMKDRRWRKQLSSHLDRIAYISDDDHNEVFGVTGIRIRNGIDLARLPRRIPQEHADGIIRLLVVAQFMPWHGVDRLIEGLSLYRRAGGDRRLELNLVGDGEAQPELKRLSTRDGLDGEVVFHGRMAPADFESLYDSCDLAIASLGMHRIGTNVASTLKTREYLAKGMPFVYAGEIDVFMDEPVDFCLQIPATDDPVDFAELIRFYDGLYGEQDAISLANRIRSYAERHIGMDAAMQPIISYLKEACAHD